MKKRAFLNKKNVKIITATGMGVFCLLTAFTASIAWFASNMGVQATGMNISVKAFDQRFRRMTLHKFIDVDNSGNYMFYRDAAGTFTYSYDSNSTVYTSTNPNETVSSFMGEYSLTSPRHPFLAIIEYSQAFVTDAYDKKITVSAQTDNPFICATDDEGEFLLGLDEDSNPLSSVIKFSANSYQSLTGIQSTTTVSGNSVNTYSLSSTNRTWDHFAQIGTDNEGNYTYDNATGWDSDKEIISVTSGTVQYVSIIFDYYDEALGYIYNRYLGNSVLEQESVPFGCDWRMVV